MSILLRILIVNKIRGINGTRLGLLNLLWWFAWGYGAGSQSVQTTAYIGLSCGFMSCIVGAVLFTVLAAVMVKKYFQDMPLGPLDEKKQEGGR